MTHLTKKNRNRLLREWTKNKPSIHERTLMRKKCKRIGKKMPPCFLGTYKSFPICTKDCKHHTGGIMSAYIRAREMYTLSKTKKMRKHKPYYYRNIANSAKRLLREK